MTRCLFCGQHHSDKEIGAIQMDLEKMSATLRTKFGSTLNIYCCDSCWDKYFREGNSMIAICSTCESIELWNLADFVNLNKQFLHTEHMKSLLAQQVPALETNTCSFCEEINQILELKMSG